MFIIYIYKHSNLQIQQLILRFQVISVNWEFQLSRRCFKIYELFNQVSPCISIKKSGKSSLKEGKPKSSLHFSNNK